MNPKSKLQIMDIGCGIGTHAIRWAKLGHDVTAIDISPTFIKVARHAAARENCHVRFLVAQIPDLAPRADYDLVTCIDFFPDGERDIGSISRLLRPDGWFLFDVRNPYHPESIRRSSDSSSWRRENGKFYLERHETDAETDSRIDEWITIDPVADLIDEEYLVSKASETKLRLFENAEHLVNRGFQHKEFRAIKGDVFAGAEDPYWLWCVART